MRRYLIEALDELSIKIGEIDEDLDVLYWLWFRPIFYYFNSFILHPDALAWDNIS